MSVEAPPGPRVEHDAAVFAYADVRRGLAGVALAHELTGPRRVPLERRGRGWELRFERPPVDRMEYLFELTRRDRRTELVPDPDNPLRAPGPFGDKSVVEFPGYEPPAWLADHDAPAGGVTALELRRGRRPPVQAAVWSAAESDPSTPLPLALVHDGPEYAEYSSLLQLFDHLVSFGELEPFRAVLLPPVDDRGETYSASGRYANLLVHTLLPQILAAAPTETRPVGIGASLGALALLHAHWMHPETFDGLLLQSGSYFRRRFDGHESDFPRFGRVTRFVGHVVSRSAPPRRIPITLTCGTGEDNLRNNRAVAAALDNKGYDVQLVERRDAHNWIAWRDALHPHFARLALRAWT